VIDPLLYRREKRPRVAKLTGQRLTGLAKTGGQVLTPVAMLCHHLLGTTLLWTGASLSRVLHVVTETTKLYRAELRMGTLVVLRGPQFLILSLFFFFWWHWGLNLGLHTCKAGTLLLEPRLQSISLW
jgi:hypothetical protein